MQKLLADTRYGLRRLLKSPGFALIVVLTLAVGIGATTAIFSVVNAVLLRPLPYESPERLVSIQHIYPGLDLKAPVSPRGFRLYRDELRSFDGVAVESGWAANLSGDGDPERLIGRTVSAEYFQTYGVEAAIGRTPLAEESEPGRDRVVVLSDGFWRRRFAGDPSIVGRDIHLNGEQYQVIGVMPPGFRGFFNRTTEVWKPLALSPEGLESNSEWLSLTARLKPGVSTDAAAAELERFTKRIQAETPGEYPPDWSLGLVTLNELSSGDLRPALLVLLGAVAFVLLIACANIANLLLARSAGRMKEVAVRRALGANRSDLVRQLLTESVVLALAGGLIGLGIAIVGVRALGALAPAGFAPGEFFAMDLRVLSFTMAVSLLTGIAFGLAPALQASGTDVQSVLREGGRGMQTERSGQVLRRALVVAEVALSLTLLVGAGLLIRSFDRLQQVDPGFHPENLLTFNVTLPSTRYPSDTARIAFFDAAREALGALPGVRAVGAAQVLPFTGGWSTGSFEVEGLEIPEGQQDPWGDQRIVTPGYFEAIGAQLIAGRTFDERDRLGSTPVVIIDSELARRYFAGRDPLTGGILENADEEGNAIRYQIIGVVAHTKQEALDAEDRVQLYWPSTQHGMGAMSFALRTAGPPEQYTAAARQAIRSVDPDQPIAQVNTMAKLIDQSVVQKRLSMLLLTFFAGIALLLAVLGIYGVMSYLVTQRSQEIGVRMALGASRGGVLAMVLRQGMVLVIAGLVLGLIGAFWLTRLLATQLFQIEATDPTTFVAVSAVLLAAAATGTLVPALRATRVDPMRALRAD